MSSQPSLVDSLASASMPKHGLAADLEIVADADAVDEAAAVVVVDLGMIQPTRPSTRKPGAEGAGVSWAKAGVAEGGADEDGDQMDSSTHGLLEIRSRLLALPDPTRPAPQAGDRGRLNRS